MALASAHPLAGRSLAGRGILVTRPRGQADALAALVRSAGGRPILFPALEIVAPADSARLHASIARLDRFDDAIFVSPTAVERAFELLRARAEQAGPLPARLRVAAVGQGSARALARHGVTQVIVPADRYDSEALLALPQFCEVAGRAVLIFRGEGGRALLAETLAGRGATVEYADCYRRVRPQADAQPLLEAWARGEVHAVTVTSAEALCNLDAMLGSQGRAALRATPLFAPHERIAAAAHELGIAQAMVTAAGDAGMVEALLDYFAHAVENAGSVGVQP